MAGLIRSIRPPDWTAVKITQYGHGVCSLNGEPCECDPGEHGFLLTEERDLNGRRDTQRFLKAGARRSLWLRARQGQLPRAYPALLRALHRDQWVMFESNSILGLLTPALYLFVLDRSQPDFKASAREYLERAHALVTIGSPGPDHPWTEVDAGLLASKPAFAVSPPDYASEQLNRYVRLQLGLSGAGRLDHG